MAHERILAMVYSVSSGARLNSLDPDAVDNLRAEAVQMLDVDDPLRRAITAFAVQHEICHRDAAALRELGEQLGRALDLALLPAPVGLDRVDIHG